MKFIIRADNDGDTDMGLKELKSRLCSLDQLKNYLGINTSMIVNQESVWLILGDIDNLQKLNQVYGKKFVDVLLDSVVTCIAETLAEFQAQEKLSGAKFNIIGDDFSIVLGRSALCLEQISSLAAKINQKLQQICQKAFVGCLLGFEQIVKEMQASELKHLAIKLLENKILVDFIPRKRGHFVLTDLAKDETPVRAAKRIISAVCRALPSRYRDNISVVLDWFYNPETKKFTRLNHNCFWPITISFGSTSSNETNNNFEVAQTSNRQLFDVMHRIADERLQARKIDKSATYIDLSKDITRAELRVEINQSALQSYAQTRPDIQLFSEDHIKTIIPELSVEAPNGMLIYLEPIYSGIFAENLTTTERLLLRGNQNGVGIKGVNTLCGKIVGDQIIRLLELSFLQSLDKLFIYSRKLFPSRFGDKLGIYAFTAIHDLQVVVAFAKNIATTFNSKIKGLKIAQFIVSLVYNNSIYGDLLYHQLELTRLSDKSAQIAFFDDYQVIIKQFCADCKIEGETLIEHKAFQSVRLLEKCQKSA